MGKRLDGKWIFKWGSNRGSDGPAVAPKRAGLWRGRFPLCGVSFQLFRRRGHLMETGMPRCPGQAQSTVRPRRRSDSGDELQNRKDWAVAGQNWVEMLQQAI